MKAVNPDNKTEMKDKKAEATDKKQAALEATLELIAEQGFHGTPMSQIAQRANIGVGTIYRYFTGKEELINELYIFIKKRMTDAILKNYDPAMTVEDSFRVVMKDIICYMAEHPTELSFHEQYANSPLITQTTKAQGVQIMEQVKDLFRRAREEDLLKDLPENNLFHMVTGAIFSLAKYYIATGVPFQEQVLNAEAEAIFDMIRKKK